MKSFWYKTKNVGDTLTPVIVKHFTGIEPRYVPRNTPGKLLAVGSIMKALRSGDVVWGAGVMREGDQFPMAKDCTFLAIRGKLSEKILGVEVGVYGDPALLLPLMYYPQVEKTKEVGYIPHYVDKISFQPNRIIDIEQPWKSFINEVLKCKRVISSSLHGIIIAEAYGIPAEWAVYSDKVLGNGFKFRDYLTGTGREIQDPGPFPPIENLKDIQIKLIDVLQKKYGKKN